MLSAYMLHRPERGVLDARDSVRECELFLLDTGGRVLAHRGAEQVLPGEDVFARYGISAREREQLFAHLDACHGTHLLHTLYGAPALFLCGGLLRAGALPMILPPAEVAEILMRAGCPSGRLEGVEVAHALRASAEVYSLVELEQIGNWYRPWGALAAPLTTSLGVDAFRDALIARCAALAELFGVRFYYDLAGITPAAMQGADLPCLLGVLMLLFGIAHRIARDMTLALSICETYPAIPLLEARLVAHGADVAADAFAVLEGAFASRGTLCEVLSDVQGEICVRLSPSVTELSAQGVKEEGELLHGVRHLGQGQMPKPLGGELLRTASELRLDGE